MTASDPRPGDQGDTSAESMAGTSGPDADADVARLQAEQARLQAEVDTLRTQLATAPRRPAGRPRRIVAAALVVLTVIVFTVSVVGVWARRNALNTDRWVATVGPIGQDPAVQQALGRWITDEVMGLIDPEALFESVLPQNGQILAAPLAGALRGFVNDQVDDFLASDTFERLWVQINRRAHARVVDVLEGDLPPSLQVEGDDVVLNVIPVLNQVLAQIGEASPEIFGRTVDIPTVSVDEVPEAAIEKIEDALGRDVPADFGQFTVFDAERLQQVQDTVTLVNRLVVFAAILSLLLVALTLGVSPSRRRTLIQLMVGIALGIVLIRRLGLRLEDDVIDLVRPENRAAVEVVVGAFVSSLLDATAWILGIALAIAAIAAVTGPYAWARALRRGTVSAAKKSVAAARAAIAHRPDDERTVAWVAFYKEALQLGGIVVGIVALLLFDLSWFGIVVLGLLVGGFELAVVRIAELAPAGEPPPEGEPTPGVPVAEPQ